MNDRILLILKTKNISASKFADEIGVQRSSISHILSGRNNPSLEFIQKILKKFPDINSDWMIFGKGSMYTNKDLFSDLEVANTNAAIHSDEGDNTSNVSNEDINLKTSEQEERPKEKQKLREAAQSGLKTGSKNTVSSVKSQAGDLLLKEGKKIERIIIFYSDKSCIEYLPE
jgi:transcriptional regulator with XRE-family HTH domain